MNESIVAGDPVLIFSGRHQMYLMAGGHTYHESIGDAGSFQRAEADRILANSPTDELLQIIESPEAASLRVILGVNQEGRP